MTTEATQLDGGNVQLYGGDALDVLQGLPAESVHCCVTSPPYFGLRDYGTGQWEGGDPGCDHTYNHGVQGESGERATRTFTGQAMYKGLCRKCGARRIDQQIGLEPTPDEYVAKLVAVFREVRRVLRDDGTIWLNIGDSYTSGGRKTRDPGQSKIHPALENWTAGRPSDAPGMKPKDLIGIPWMVAFALRADGWYLRQDIIWHKPNPMPESVTDRCTKAHEYIFLLSKKGRYYYDAEAIAEPSVGESPISRMRIHDGLKQAQLQSMAASTLGTPANKTRNKRSVWTIPTQPYPEAHFATFPPALIEPCILAGCPRGGTVLDPFAGSGTTGQVAVLNDRRAVLIELNPEYHDLIRKRVEPVGEQPLFVTTEATRKD